MRALSEFLWHEHDVLELVLHRLETERALRETGRVRRLALAGREVQDAVEKLRTAELARVTEAAAATEVLGLPATSSLRTIAGLAPVPWGGIFLEQHAAMKELVDAIIALDDDLPPASPEIGGPGPGVLGDADAAVTDAVIELELDRIGRQAAEVRGPTMREALLEFLS